MAAFGRTESVVVAILLAESAAALLVGWLLVEMDSSWLVLYSWSESGSLDCLGLFFAGEGKVQCLTTIEHRYDSCKTSFNLIGVHFLLIFTIATSNRRISASILFTS